MLLADILPVLQWSAVELGLIYFFAPETYKPQVLKIKAAQSVARPGRSI
jgi:hypothetical protein